jgi:hypothetical protein
LELKQKNEYDRFQELTRRIFSVPHSEVKAKLDAEKAAKKRKKSKQSSASREANGRA